MFVDELTIEAKAGDGGEGVVRWLRLRHMPKGGPAGGNGGRGGNVYVRAIRDLNILSKYTGDKLFNAENGAAGSGRSKYGKDGEDTYIDVPIGSKITNTSDNSVYVLESEGEVIQILSGGQGGLGNEHFKSSTNRTPEESTKGTKGESGEFRIEVTLSADVGIIGLPNAGKSTLINAFTNATSAVGVYPFTTLEPHLGELFGFVLADIPGLIEGASKGKGLGHKFLRHVSRTKMLLHCVSLEGVETDGVGKLQAEYETIRKELDDFNTELSLKEEWVVLTKSDLASEKLASEALESFKKYKKPVFLLSVEANEGVKELRDTLIKHLREQNSPHQ